MPLLSTLELEILRKLVNREEVHLSSQHRLRLELAGVIREGPNGIEVTLAGRTLAGQAPADTKAVSVAPDDNVERDKRGRRMPRQRKSVF